MRNIAILSVSITNENIELPTMLIINLWFNIDMYFLI